MNPIEVRIPADETIDHATLFELECFGRFSKFKLSRARLLVHHGELIRVMQNKLTAPEVVLPMRTTFQGAPVEYVVGPFSTFEYSPVQ